MVGRSALTRRHETLVVPLQHYGCDKKAIYNSVFEAVVLDVFMAVPLRNKAEVDQCGRAICH